MIPPGFQKHLNRSKNIFIKTRLKSLFYPQIGLLFLSKDLTFCECIIGLMVMYYLLSLCLFLRNNNVSVLALYFLFSLIYRLNNDQFPVNYAIFCIVIIHVYYIFEELDSKLKVKRLILGFKAQ